MSIKATVKSVNTNRVSTKINKIKSNSSLGMFAALEAARLMQPYVPEREGILKGSVLMSEPWVVVYSTPYAAYQYYGVSKSGGGLRYSKPTARSHWEQGINKGDLARSLTAYIKRL